MYALFIGMTILAVNAIFSGQMGYEYIMLRLADGYWPLAIRYALAALLVAAFFFMYRVPFRLPQKLAGRGWLYAGIAIYVINYALVVLGISAYRPGVGAFLALLQYVVPISMAMIFVGTSRVLLGDRDERSRG